MNSDLEQGVNVDRANFSLLSQQGLQSSGNLATKMTGEQKEKCTNTCGTFYLKICETDLLPPLPPRTALSRRQDSYIHLEGRSSFI